MTKKIDQLTPNQIRERGRELLRLAQKKEDEIKNKELIQIGEIFKREIIAGWPTSWDALEKELMPIFGEITKPKWGFSQGIHGASLVSGEAK